MGNGRYIQTIHIRGNQTGPETRRGRASLIIRNDRGAIFFAHQIGKMKTENGQSWQGHGETNTLTRNSWRYKSPKLFCRATGQLLFVLGS